MNRFDTVRPENFRYMSTYVPAPLAEMADLAKDYSTRYRQGKQLSNELGMLASKVKAAPMDYELKNQFIQDANKQMQGLVDTAKPEDWANPDFQDKMRNTLGQIASDPRLNTIQSNKKWFDDEYTKYKSDPKNSKDLDFSLQTVPTSGPGSHPTGFKQNLEGVSFSGLNVTPYKESYDDTAKIMSNIPSNSKEGGVWDFNHTKTINNGETQVYNKTTNKYETVSPEQIKQVAQISTPLFGRTDSGLYRIRKALAPIYGSKVQNLDYDTLHQMSEQDPSGETMKRFNEVNDILYDDLYRTAFKQAFKKTSYDQDITKETDNNAVAKNKLSREQGLVQSLETGNTLELVSPDYKELKNSGLTNENGEIDFVKLSTKLKGTKAGDKEAGDRIASSGGWLNLNLGSNEKNINEDITKVTKVAKQAINTIGKDKVEELLGKPISELNGKDLNKLFSQYNEYTKARGYNGNKVDGLEKKALEMQVSNDPTNYEVLDKDLQLSSKEGDKFKKDLYNSNDYQFNINSRVNMNGKSYLTASLANKETGEVKEVLLRPKTLEYNAHFDNAAKVSKAINDSYATGENLKKSQDTRFQGDVLAEAYTDSGNSKTIVYKTPEGNETVVKYDIKKVPSDVIGKYDRVLSNGTVVGNSFKEYQQGLHSMYGYTAEGRKMYENTMTKKDATKENVK